MKKNVIKNWGVIFILLLFFVSPFFLAKWFFYQHGSDVVSTLGTVNHGKLIQPPIPLKQILKSTTHKILLKHKWYIFYVLNAKANQNADAVLDKIQRIRLALGKDFSQVGAVLGVSQKIYNVKVDPAVLSEVSLSQKGIQHLLAFSENSQGIFIMDPQFNIILSYPTDVNSEAIYRDIQRLLKYSENSAI